MRCRLGIPLEAACCVLVVSAGFGRTLAQDSFDFASATEALSNSCGDCHSDVDSPEGGFSLGELTAGDSLADRYDLWVRVASRLHDGSMPPPNAEPLAMDERLGLVAWVERASRDAIRKRGEGAGAPMFRRMTAREYSNTVRDLLNSHFDAGHALPQDAAGGEGFDNAAETLTISPVHAEKYVEAAVEALAYAASDEDSRKLLLPHRASGTMSEAEAARANLREFAARAFRRPVIADDVEIYAKLYEDARADEMAFEPAMFYALRAVLTSPRFLFLSETSPEPGVEGPLTDWELATRLSYFLWASTPDQELFDAAAAGRLSEPAELRKQTLRMLESGGTHFHDSLVQFVGQWLGTADLGGTKQLDIRRHPWIAEPYVAAMRNQPVYIVESLLRTNGSLVELLDSDWTFVNSDLVSALKLENDADLEEKIQQHLVRVKLPENKRHFSGLLGSSGVLAVTSYPQRTSPVLRGVWVLDKLLGFKSPPPPPNVPPLAEGSDGAEPQTVRARLESHRADPACAACHDRIDPAGLALENFDELGRWRDRDEGGPIDATAVMPDGQSIDGLAGLKHYLVDHREQFARHLTELMLGYALSRGLVPSDRATVEAVVERLQQNDYRAQELILGIVESKPFRFKRGPQQ